MEKLNYNGTDFKSKIRYCEHSPTGLVNFYNQPVGSKDYDKFGNPKAIRVSLNRKRFLAHRVIWVLNYGSIDSTLMIDHIDGNPFNNSITNLRLVSGVINQRNRSKNVNNKTGEHGVAYHKTSNNSGGFNEYVRPVWVDLNGKQCHADFNIKKFPSFEDAVEFAALYRELAITDNKSYSETHGVRESKRNTKETNE